MSHLGSLFPSPSHPPHPAGSPSRSLSSTRTGCQERRAPGLKSKQAASARSAAVSPVRWRLMNPKARSQSASALPRRAYANVRGERGSDIGHARSLRGSEGLAAHDALRMTQSRQGFFAFKVAGSSRPRRIVRSVWCHARRGSASDSQRTRPRRPGCDSVLAHRLSRERRRQPTLAGASARDQNLVRGKFSGR